MQKPSENVTEKKVLEVADQRGGSVWPFGCYTDVADLKVLPHEQVERRAGVGSDDADAAAAAPQQPQTQVGTLLGLLLKQQFRKLQKQREVNSPCLDKRQTAEEMGHIWSKASLTFDTSALWVAKQCWR